MKNVILIVMLYTCVSFSVVPNVPSWLKQKLEDVVNINSGSYNPEGNEKVRQVLIPMFESLGFKARVETVGSTTSPKGDSQTRKVLVFEFPDTTPDILFVGHTDTVFEPFHPFQKFSIDGDKWRGPGAADTKGGLVFIYHVLSEIKDKNLLKRIRIAFNDDEELGSKISGAFLKTLADKAKSVLIIESSGKTADVSKSHSGIFVYEMTVYGRESHAGQAPKDGVNACLENSYKMIDLFKLNKFDRGLTLNPGVVNTPPAAKHNIVCGEIKTLWDIRFIYPEDLEKAKLGFQKIAAKNYAPNFKKQSIKPTILKEIQFAPALPPERTKRLVDMFLKSAKAKKIKPVVEHKGGVDAYGIIDAPVDFITGIGVNGDGMHSDQEYLDINMYPRKFELVSGFLDELLSTK